MKSFVVLFGLFCAINAFALSEEQICQNLEEKAWDNCREIMCRDWIEADGGVADKKNIEECLANADGDLNEGAQICVVDGGEFDSLIKEYNAKHPGKEIKCEQN